VSVYFLTIVILTIYGLHKILLQIW